MHSFEEVQLNQQPIKVGRKKASRMMFTEYIDQCLRIILTVLVGEIIFRSCRIFYEYIYYEHHYDLEMKLWQIFLRSFSINIATIVTLLLVLCLIIVRLVSSSHCSFLPPLKYFLFIPLWLVYRSFSMHHSQLDYANWIREPHGLDYAEGMASNYFHGYLKLVLPADRGHLGLHDRIELYEDKHQVKFAVKRLVILVPSAFFSRGKIESRLLRKDGVEPLETVVLNRAGVARPFKNDVYAFREAINGTFYYVALESATPMLSFFESMNYQPSTTWQMKLVKREILLKFYKHLKKLCYQWPETRDEIELVLYNEFGENGRPQDVGDVLLAHITNMWNEGRT